MKLIKWLRAGWILSAVAGAAGGVAGAAAQTTAVPLDAGAPTVVLVHGAFADGSSWDRVIPLLFAKGLKVVAVQNPLSSLAADVDAAARVINQQSGPVVLVGHSWGGAVITQAGTNDKVKALVYVAAFAPEEGKSVNDMLKGGPPAAWAATLQADAKGFLTLPAESFKRYFAQDLPEPQSRLMAATQGPFFSGCMDDKIGTAAWRNKPSWYVLAEDDQIIPPALQASMSAAMKAKVTRVRTSHVPMLSQPEAVAAAIVEATQRVK